MDMPILSSSINTEQMSDAPAKRLVFVQTFCNKAMQHRMMHKDKI